MSLISSAPFSNVTTYRKDYNEKNAPRPPRVYPIPEYADPVAGPLEEHVLPRSKYEKLPPDQTKYPNPEEYAKEVAENYPSTRIFLRDPPGGPPDLDVIDKFYENENRTTYMMAYCILGDYDSRFKQGSSTKILPEGWVIPITTHKCSYRPPLLVAPEGVTTDIVKPPPDNLGPKEREREVLQVTTGETIYMTDIGDTGTEIIEGKLHGDVNIRPKIDQEDLLKEKLIKTYRPF